MLDLPKEEWFALAKRTLIACDGHVRNAAELLGLKYKALSGALNRGELAVWWIPYKEKLMLKRAQGRYRRAYERRKVRAFIDSGVPRELAEELAALRAPRDGWGTALQGRPVEALEEVRDELLEKRGGAPKGPRKKGRRKGARAAPGGSL